jgi:hypothetical protein
VLEARRFCCAEVERIRGWLAAHGCFELVVEATAAYEWFVPLGEPHAGSGMLPSVLNQASWQLVQRWHRWRRTFEAIAKRNGKKKAIAATSRRLLCVMTAIINSGQPYRTAA